MKRIATYPLVILFLGLATALGADVATNVIDPNTVYGAVPITCKLEYYAKFEYDHEIRESDIRLLVADPLRTNIATMKVDGVVMKILTPKELVGKAICIWLDSAPHQVAEVHYKRGVVYRGYCYPRYVGTLGFKAEGNLEPVAEPNGAASRSQPVKSGTNRTPAAAGSGR